MAGLHFHGMIRTLSKATHRRGALGALAALLLVGGGSPVGAERCTSKADCRGRIDDRCVRARCRHGRCVYAAIRCASGYRCCGNGRCCAA